jgi:hypothetical protein
MIPQYTTKHTKNFFPSRARQTRVDFVGGVRRHRGSIAYTRSDEVFGESALSISA